MALYDQLLAYVAENRYPMHMPGHKRNLKFVMENPYAFDVTEVEGTDQLHHPTGIIRQEMDRLKEIYGTKDTYLLVNGSTCGLLAAVSACCRHGDLVAVARNCHHSVYHAIEILGLEPLYIYPKTDPDTGICLGITAEQVREVLTDRIPSCVILTSPTYEGVVSEISEIAEIVHEKEIPLLVDEAHGAHFAWCDKMPSTAMRQGADLVVESLHKTLPALTQTGLLHRMTDRISAKKVEHYLKIYETSSPSYILMASISQCIKWLQAEGETWFNTYVERLMVFRKQAEHWRHLSLWECSQKEPSKLIILTKNTSFTGPELADRLRDTYQIEVEMAASGYIIAMTSVCDTAEGMQRFAMALSEIDAGLQCDLRSIKSLPADEKAVIRKSIEKAVKDDGERLPLSEAVGRISTEYVMVYPPGIPFLVPGEEITLYSVEQIQRANQQGLSLSGLEDETGETIGVCRQEEL